MLEFMLYMHDCVFEFMRDSRHVIGKDFGALMRHVYNLQEDLKLVQLCKFLERVPGGIWRHTCTISNHDSGKALRGLANIADARVGAQCGVSAW